MKYNCNIIRDLLPLYADAVCSEDSRAAVRQHIAECPDCAALLARIQAPGPEAGMEEERNSVLLRQRRNFRRRSALAGGVIAGIYMIPVLVCLIVNLASGKGLSWFFIVLASLLTAASLTVVPLMIPEHKGLWTLGTFTASLLLLLAVCCLYTGGRWFFVASLPVLFGLSLFFLPAVVHAGPFPAVLQNRKGLFVMSADTVLYALMMLAIGLYVRVPGYGRTAAAVSLPFMLLAWALFALIRYPKCGGLVKAGICTALCGVFFFIAEPLVSLLLGKAVIVYGFAPLIWNPYTVTGNAEWLFLLSCLLAGAVFIASGIIRKRRKSK